MASCCFLLPQFQARGSAHSSLVQGKGSSPSASHYHADLRRNGTRRLRRSSYGACCSLQVPAIVNLSQTKITDVLGSNIGEMHPGTEIFKQSLVVLDLDPATAKVAIAFLGPFLSAFAFLFVLRIVMSWYPKLPVKEFPYVIAYAPTEPILTPTRKLIPPLGGVDVTPVVWFGLISFLNEILVGPQGLLVLLSQQEYSHASEAFSEALKFDATNKKIKKAHRLKTVKAEFGVEIYEIMRVAACDLDYRSWKS